MQGERFGMLTVLELFARQGKPMGARVLCDCGVEKVTCSRSVRRGRTRSCGCLQRETATKHGLSRHPHYSRWNGMVQRCHNPNWINYADYGGRGVSVCDSWRKNPESFFKWLDDNGCAGGLEVDRIDNGQGYSPENCRLVTRRENMRNQRNNTVIEVFGESMTVAEASERFSVPYDRLIQRLTRLGWDPERAVTAPQQKGAQ